MSYSKGSRRAAEARSSRNEAAVAIARLCGIFPGANHVVVRLATRETRKAAIRPSVSGGDTTVLAAASHVDHLAL